MKAMICAVALVGCVEAGQDASVEATAATQQALGPDVVGHAVMNGGGLGFGNYDMNTGTYYFVVAQESGVGPSRTATLMFNLYRQGMWHCDDPWSCTYTPTLNIWGQGAIAPADLTVAPTADSGRLVTTTGPNFWVTSCSDWACTPGGTYSFDLTFTGNDVMHMTRSGTSSFTMGTPDMSGQILQFRESGTYETQGATVSGTAFDLAITNGQGQIQHSSGAQVTRDLVRTTR